jgi:hypothetical protein
MSTGRVLLTKLDGGGGRGGGGSGTGDTGGGGGGGGGGGASDGCIARLAIKPAYKTLGRDPSIVQQQHQPVHPTQNCVLPHLHERDQMGPTRHP